MSVRPVQLCRFCKPGSPCPMCVEKHGIHAWDLADLWAAEIKREVVPTYEGSALKEQQVVPRSSTKQ